MQPAVVRHKNEKGSKRNGQDFRARSGDRGAFGRQCGAAPLTKQNGRDPAFSSFTPICAMAAFLNYGDCNGDAAMFANVSGRINAVQPKPGRWNLE